MNKQLPHIKKAQKEALLLKELSQLLLQIALDDSRLEGVFITHAELSSDKSVCNVYFYTAQGFDHFQEIRSILILYKPSMRKALAHQIPSRYVPNLVFKFDDKFEKQMKLEKIFNDIKSEETEEQE